MQPLRTLLIVIACTACPPAPAPSPPPLGVEPGGVVELAPGTAAQAVTVSGPGRLYEIQDQQVVFQLGVDPDRSFPSQVTIPARDGTASPRYVFAAPLTRGDGPPYDGPGKCPPDLPPSACGVLCIRCQPCCVTPPQRPDPTDPRVPPPGPRPPR